MFPVASPGAQFLDLDALAATPLASEPFPYLIVPGFLGRAALDAIAADFPRIDKPGSFPTSELSFGKRFQTLLDELEGPAMREICAAKFAIDLSQRPTMVTVRGRAQRKDGRIHADSKTKLITVLIYMNEKWEAPGGQLRLLRSPDNLADYVVEVPPVEGTLLAFKVTPHSWHGHAPSEGERRVIQLNWVTDEAVVRHEQARHRFSARLKRLFAPAY
jgi:SM-20-related protein